MSSHHTRSSSDNRQLQPKQTTTNSEELNLKLQPNQSNHYINNNSIQGINTDGAQNTPPSRHQPSIVSEIQEANEDMNDNSSDISPSIFGTAPVGEVGKSKPRAVVRIERDYSARGASFGRVQFWDGWVEELEGRISPLQFQDTLNDFNLILASAYDPYLSIIDNTLAILSLYISPWFIDTHYKKQMKIFKETLDQYNRQIYNPVGLNILHPRKVAFLFLEVEYY